MKPNRDQLGKRVYDLIWEKADDVISSIVYLGELYDNVPEHLKNVPISQMTIHTIDPKYRQEVLEFLNDKR